MDRQQADQINRRDFKLVACPTCKPRDREFCPTCGGEGEIPRWRADEL